MSSWQTRASWLLWLQKCRKETRRFQAALKDPKAAQKAQLSSILQHAGNTSWARHYKIDANTSLDTFRERVPIQAHSDLKEWTDRIIRGEDKVLTNNKVERLVPTSGTTGHSKLIPMTSMSREEFSTAVNLWLFECHRRAPGIKFGKAYIATSPALDSPGIKSVVPIGFAEDAAYLGALERWVLKQIIAVPTEIAQLRGSRWRTATRECLFRAQDLSFLSLWHPSYLEALFDPDEIRDLSRRWKNLDLISSWSDGACSPAATRLLENFPQAKHQAKGLWLTEGVITIPWENRCPLALLSGFFEFVTEDGAVLLSHQVEQNGVYRPLLTNHAGLYRYRLGDLVRVDGFIGQTPTFQWVGRADKVIDLCGEKLTDAQVSHALETIGWNQEAILSPVKTSSPPHYRCYIANNAAVFPIAAFENVLKQNPHYAWAREIGQLSGIEVCKLTPAQYKVLSKSNSHHKKGTHLLEN